MILLFHREAVLRGMGTFFESVVFHSSYEVSCFLLVVCLFFGWAVWFLFLLFVCVGCCFLVGWETP